MKVISYSLFGYDKAKHPNCFDFNSLLRGFAINLRLSRLLFPDWKIYIAVDKPSKVAFSDYFDRLEDQNLIYLEVMPPAPLCEAMLWRMNPVLQLNQDTTATYTHVICRDLDSPLTYRDRQAVQYWVDNGKAAHAITDSISHDVYMLGGMIGFVPKYFTMRTNIRDFTTLIQGYDLSQKGSDQTLLNSKIYPHFGQKGSESITQHYFKGMGRTNLNDYHCCICWSKDADCGTGHKAHCYMDLKLSDVPETRKHLDSVAQHMGSAGWNSCIDKELNKYYTMFNDFRKIESQYPDVFYWIKEGSF